MLKDINNAFDSMELAFCLINHRIISVKIGFKLFFQEITFITELPSSNILLPPFSTESDGKWDFQVANLLLATVNFQPWQQLLMSKLTNEQMKRNIKQSPVLFDLILVILVRLSVCMRCQNDFILMLRHVSMSH